MQSINDARAGSGDQRADAGTARTLDGVLAEARSRYERVAVADLDAAVAEGALLVDIRPVEQRRRDGDLPGALVIDRNVLEWRLAPSSAARVIEAGDGRQVILVCNEGYQSSLAAAVLRDLGVSGATDLIGGYQAYLAGRRGASNQRVAAARREA